MKNFYVRIMPIFTVILLVISGCSEDEPVTNNPESEYGVTFGYTLETADELLAYPVADTTILFANRMEPLQSSYSLFMPPIKQQGSEPTCGGFAAAYAVRSFKYWLDNPGTNYSDHQLFSPEFVNNEWRNGDCDKKIGFINILNILKTKGCCTLDVLDYSDGNGCSSSTFEANGYYSNALCYRIDWGRRMNTTKVKDLKRFLQQGYPLMVGFTVDESFIKLNESDPVNFIWNPTQSTVSDPESRFDHAVVICGWNDTKNAWKVMNSWGTQWGDAGYGWIDYDAFESIVTSTYFGYQDLYAIYVMKTSPEPSLDCCYPGGDNDLEIEVLVDKNVLTVNQINGDQIVDFLWDDGSTTQSITVDVSGSIGVTVTDEFGCTKYATGIVSPAVVVLTVNPVSNNVPCEICDQFEGFAPDSVTYCEYELSGNFTAEVTLDWTMNQILLSGGPRTFEGSIVDFPFEATAEATESGEVTINHETSYRFSCETSNDPNWCFDHDDLPCDGNSTMKQVQLIVGHTINVTIP